MESITSYSADKLNVRFNIYEPPDKPSKRIVKNLFGFLVIVIIFIIISQIRSDYIVVTAIVLFLTAHLIFGNNRKFGKVIGSVEFNNKIASLKIDNSESKINLVDIYEINLKGIVPNRSSNWLWGTHYDSFLLTIILNNNNKYFLHLEKGAVLPTEPEFHTIPPSLFDVIEFLEIKFKIRVVKENYN